MNRFMATISITLKPTVNDPEGLTIASALHNLGFTAVKSVKAGKQFNITIDAVSSIEASKQTDQMCSRLLANPVIETYEYEIAEVTSG